MVVLDQIARNSTIVLLAILAVVLARDGRRIPSAGAAVALFVTVAAHLILTAPGYAGVGGLEPVLMAAAFVVPAAFLLFSRALFEEEYALTWRDLAIVATLLVTGFMRGTALSRVGAVLFYATSLALVLIALARVGRGLPSDLVEPRRRLRAVFTAAIGVTILLVIGGEILLFGQPSLLWAEAVKSTGALGLTFLFATWFLAPRLELFAPQPLTGSVADPPANAVGSGEDTRFRDRLLALMRDERAYRQEGLTIAALARKLDLPEYRLRRVINQQLGYRNFNAFLNDFRIEDACRILADPGQERLPILNLALDLGFGSPGPFNRAFRAKTGHTPTDYRRARLGSSSPEA